MLGTLLRRLAGVPKLLLVVAIFKADVEDSLKDADVRAAWERFTTEPDIAGIFPRLSAEWRAVEEALGRLK